MNLLTHCHQTCPAASAKGSSSGRRKMTVGQNTDLQKDRVSEKEHMKVKYKYFIFLILNSSRDNCLLKSSNCYWMIMENMDKLN